MAFSVFGGFMYWYTAAFGLVFRKTKFWKFIKFGSINHFIFYTGSDQSENDSFGCLRFWDDFLFCDKFVYGI